MALTLLTDAYDSVANIDTYWSDRGGTDWAGLSTANKEIYIRKATDWVDRNFTFSGTRKTSSQRLKWPRSGAIDRDGYSIGSTDAPWQVKEATAIIADLYRNGTYDLEGIITDDSAILKERVDVVEIEYSEKMKKQGKDIISHVYQLLYPITIDDQLMRA